MEVLEKIYVVDATFPDEDERIGNEIISFLKEGTPYYCPNSVRRQEWIAWLEKQSNKDKLINKLSKKNESDETASDETAKAFARIIRANLTGIDKDVQYKFEQLYKEITGKKMYQGYSD